MPVATPGLGYNDLGYLERRGAPADRNTELLLVDPLGRN
jgi:hypothetical protein